MVDAIVLLPIVCIALRTVGWSRSDAALRRIDRPASGVSLARARRISQLVMAVIARSPFDHNCLRRSLVLRSVLWRNGLDAQLRLGVERHSDGTTPRFHAWVEHERLVLNDRPDVATRYAAFGDAVPRRHEAAS